MRHNNIESISAITYNQQPSMEASMADANNNHNGSGYVGHHLTVDGTGTLVSEIKKDEKYSLRQRQSRRTTLEAKSVSKTTTNSTNTTTSSSSAREKATPKEKPKPKAAPLSKYRRKTANARERSRMREINSAFENLRHAVPVAVAGTSGTSSPVSSPQCSAASSEKLTKITTLRLAMKYIRILSDMLHGTPGTLENNNELDMVNHNEIEREVMQKGLLLLEGGTYPMGGHGYISSSPAVSPARPSVDPKPSPKASSKNSSQQSSTSSSSSSSTNSPRKRTSAKKSTSSNSRSKKSTSTSTTNRSRGAAGTNGRKTITTPPTLEKIDDSIQLTAPSLLPDPSRPDPLGMDVDLCSVLESDNDSLILSEPCLSPLTTAGTGPGGLKSHSFGCNHSASVVPNDGLEFGLFLESDADSLQLSEPCLSPLSHLDSLNPFNDLLHTGFNEQTALELYL